jgi:DNA-directed RNA polymerase sigma subunit (sigma70/sigma32)
MPIDPKKVNLPWTHEPRRTQGEVAKMMGLSRNRISQIEIAALKKLAEHPLVRRHMER